MRKPPHFAKCVGPNGESIGAYEELKQYLSYDAEIGIFTWTEGNGRRIRIGDRAGTRTNDGYRYIRFNSLLYREHRLAWFFATGEDPASFSIDHINRIRDDNRFINLRLATQAQNSQNKPAHNGKLKGVKIGTKRYHAQIRAFGSRYYLGTFDTPELAHQAYCEASKRLHGEFGSAS